MAYEVVLSQVCILSVGGVNHRSRAEGHRPTSGSWERAVSHVWLCPMEGEGIRGKLSLENLFRDFQVIFPNSSNYI